MTTAIVKSAENALQISPLLCQGASKHGRRVCQSKDLESKGLYVSSFREDSFNFSGGLLQGFVRHIQDRPFVLLKKA